MTLLYEIAHARSGDKGEMNNICVFPYRDEDYPILLEQLTAERVREHFAGVVSGRVERYEVPSVHGLNFLLYGTRAGGVSSALELDVHGKNLSYGLLMMEVALPESDDRVARRGAKAS